VKIAGFGRKAVVGTLTVVAVLTSMVTSMVMVTATGATAGTPRLTATQVDFPAYMHDGAHSAFSSDATAITPTGTLSLAYTFQENRIAKQPRPAFFSTPLVLQHVIYEGSNSGEFYAINLSTGAVIWKEFLGFEAKVLCRAQGFYAAAASGIDPTSGALTIYAPSGDGNVYALRASDGLILWKSPVNVPSPGTNDHFNFSSPEVANGKVYIGISSECDNAHSPISIRGGLASLDQATGNRVATYLTVPPGDIGGSIWSSPAIAADGSVIVTTGDAPGNSTVGDTQSVVRLDPDTLTRIDGYQLVTTTADSDFGGSPTIFTATIGGVPTPMVGACNKNGFYYAWKVNALAAGPVWKVKIAGHADSTGNCLAGAIWDGSNLYEAGPRTTINGQSYRGSIRKLNPATGAALWTTGLPAAIMTSPTLDGAGAIAAASFDTTGTSNSAFLINAATGSFRVVADGNMIAAPSPVFGDQSLVIATAAGSIYTYQAQ
jgi:polyvinyl alcohol dehydrogenase (cytochrome)